MNQFLLHKKVLVWVLSLALISTTLACTTGYGNRYSNRYGSGGASPQQAYSYGYQRGHDHGLHDRREGANPNYEHDEQFRYGISRDRYINDAFRRGYVEGYRTGYYGGRRY